MKKFSLLLALCLLMAGMNFSFAFAGNSQIIAYSNSDITITATQIENGSIKVNWDCPASDFSNVDLIISYPGHPLVTKTYNTSTGEYILSNVYDDLEITASVRPSYNDGTELYKSTKLTCSADLWTPEAPSDLSAKIESDGDVTLTWTDNASYETGFDIAKEDSNGDGGVTELSTADQKKYVDNVAHTAGMTYKYKVRAYNYYGNSAYTNEVAVTFPNSASDAPSNCAAKLQSDGSVKVTWTDNSNWETGFTVTRTDGNGTNKYFDAAANATSYSDTEKLTAGMTYKYSVAAHDDNGQSGDSNQVSVTIPAATTTTPAVTVPAAPSNLTAKQDQDKIKLTWNDNSDNETGFVLTRTDDKGSAATSTTLAAGTKSYTDAQSISAGTTYTYVLKAVNAAGSSSEAKVTLKAASTEASGFTFDGTQSSWAKTEITQAYNDGLTYDGVMGNFGRNITREEFCTIVVKMYEKISGKKAVSSDNPFTDVVSDDVVKAFRLGIVKGTSATTFSPDNKITRQEISVMITRCLEASVSGINISSNSSLSFADSNQIASWAKESMGYCNAVGIMNGVGNNKIAPLSNTTREQAIALIERTFQEYN